MGDIGQTSVRRTKRRYAHELYPHSDGWEVRPLTVDVPYNYAMAIGNEVEGTGWFHANAREREDRTVRLIYLRRIAFLADALLQGMAGDAAYRWAEESAAEESGELVWERAVHYGVNPALIKPYPCGSESDTHRHFSDPDTRSGLVTYVDGPEEDCPDCTEGPC